MPRSMSRDAELRERAARVIPGGMYGHESTALLPAGYPQFFSRAAGSRLWDADGNEYIDYMCAYGPNLFGYADAEIDRAAIEQLARGDALTGPTELMVDLAEELVAMVAHADWAMFCKNGSDATTLAMMAARAHTGRRKILIAKGAYHGAQPWSTPVPAGVVAEDRAHLISFVYNDLDSLERAVREAGTDLAGVFVSAFKHDAFVDQELPTPEFARAVREHCDRSSALLILDEVRGGFRLSRDGSWTHLGVAPDLSAWGKCLANGHAISALLGSENVRAAASRLYVTGSFWFQAAPMAAALATLRRVRESDYLERTRSLGTRLRQGLAELAAAHGYRLRQTGPAQMPLVRFEDDPDFRRGFAWTGEAVKRGVYLHPWHNMFVCAALGEGDVDKTLAVSDEAFAAVRRREATLEPHATVAALLAGGR